MDRGRAISREGAKSRGRQGGGPVGRKAEEREEAGRGSRL